MRSKLLFFVLALAAMAGTAWAGDISIKGSTTVLPIAQVTAEAYMEKNPDVSISISGGGSGNGIKAIIDDTTDIANSSRFIKEKEVALAVERGSYPVPFAVAYDSIVPIVHPSNPVQDLTLDQLKAIYTGEIRNWEEVGGPDRKVVVISRDTSSGTYEVWEEEVLENERVTPRALLQASNGAVGQAVTNNPNAIGYVGIGYLNPSIKELTVEGIQGNPENAKSGKYPVARALFMFTNGWPEGETSDFIRFIQNPETGQKLVLEAGFVPLY
ncbi:MAG: phosphate ABC transporter substrate-binding protein [Desulfovibrionales bacterium]